MELTKHKPELVSQYLPRQPVEEAIDRKMVPHSAVIASTDAATSEARDDVPCRHVPITLSITVQAATITQQQ